MINFHSPQRESDWNRIHPRACSGCGSREHLHEGGPPEAGKEDEQKQEHLLSTWDLSCAPLLLTASSTSTSFCLDPVCLPHPDSSIFNLDGLVGSVSACPGAHELFHGFYFSSCIWSHWLVAPSLYNHKCSKGTL